MTEFKYATEIISRDNFAQFAICLNWLSLLVMPLPNGEETAIPVRKIQSPILKHLIETTQMLCTEYADFNAYKGVKEDAIEDIINDAHNYTGFFQDLMVTAATFEGPELGMLRDAMTKIAEAHKKRLSLNIKVNFKK